METNDIVSGIVKAIKSYLDCRVYGDTVPQGAVRPYFTIDCISAGHYPKLNNTAKKSRQFSIEYHPNDITNWREECMCVADIIGEILQELDINGIKLEGSDVECVPSDGVLVSTVTYRYMAHMVHDADMMEKLNKKVELHG